MEKAPHLSRVRKFLAKDGGSIEKTLNLPTEYLSTIPEEDFVYTPQHTLLWCTYYKINAIRELLRYSGRTVLKQSSKNQV